MYQCLGIEWNDKKPYLRYRTAPDSLDENLIELTSGQKFSIRISGVKYCTGYVDQTTHQKVLCPSQAVVYKKDFHQCYSCRKHETLLYFSLSSLDETQRSVLKGKEHIVYLNLFGTEIIKVGVSTEANKWRRVLEQGADSTLFFVHSDGIIAREIENFVSKHFPITQAVPYVKKLKLLHEFLTPEESKAKLLQHFFKIKLSLNKEYQETLLDIPQFSYNEAYYQLHIPENLPGLEYIDEVSEGDMISGEITGIPGQILLLKNSSFYALQTNKLKGFLFNPDETNQTVQIKLPQKSVSLNQVKTSSKASIDLFS